jgi:hypothetical protein
MNTHTSTRAAALSLAIALTLGILSSINLLATSPAPDTLLAAIDGPASQTIVIEGKRLSHS